MNRFIIGVFLLASVIHAQDQSHDIKSQAHVFWHDLTPWGPPVVGLRLSIDALRDAAGQLRGLRLAIQNVATFPQGLALGFLSNTSAQIPSTLILTTTTGQHEFKQVDITANGGLPMVVPLLPLAVYTSHVPLGSYHPIRPGISLETALKQATGLSVRLAGDKSVCDAYGYPHPNYLPCWSGALASNVIRLSPR